MKPSGMNLKITNGGWVELYNSHSKELFCECFYNLSKVVQGKGFVAVLLKSGRLEIYNTKLQLVASHHFQGIKSVSVTEMIEIVFLNGIKKTFNRQLEPVISTM